MKKCFCDICGEEIIATEESASFDMYSNNTEHLYIDAHKTCYMILFDRVKRCVEGEKINRPNRV